MQRHVDSRMTLADYHALEALSPSAHEYRNGFAIALAVPTGAHATIAMNLSIELAPAARAAGCLAYAGDVKVVTPRGDRLIPDFIITCDARDRESVQGGGEAQIEHPWLVVEILSPATAADDMTSKLDAYQTIADVTHYVVIDSRRRAMRAFERTSDARFASSGPLVALDLPRLGRPPVTIEALYRDAVVPMLDDVSPAG